MSNSAVQLHKETKEDLKVYSQSVSSSQSKGAVGKDRTFWPHNTGEGIAENWKDSKTEGINRKIDVYFRGAKVTTRTRSNTNKQTQNKSSIVDGRSL